MNKIFLISSVFITLLLVSCSMIPKDYEPNQYRDLVIIAMYPEIEEVDISDMTEVIDALVSDVAEGILDVSHHWDITTDIAQTAIRCGYNVYLIAPQDYFNYNTEPLELAGQRIFEGWVSDYYSLYIEEMKDLWSGPNQPVAYITGKQDPENDKIFWIEMRHWDNDKKIFKMTDKTFFNNYNEFFCGADIQ